MTLYEKNLFADAISQLDTELPPLTQGEQTDLYQLILTRSGIAAHTARRRRTAKRAWLIAAVLAGLTLLAAGYYSVRDAFHGILAEPVPAAVSAQNPSIPQTKPAADTQDTRLLAPQADTPAAPRVQPVDQTAELVEKTGVLPMQSVTADGLTVTLQAAIFDEMSTRLIVEVASQDGSSLEAKHERIAQRFGLHIKQAMLVVDGQSRRFRLTCNLLEEGDNGVDSSVRFMLDGDGLPKEARGKTAKLVLSDFVEDIEFDPKTDPAAAKGEMSLSAFAAQLGEPDMSLFKVHAVTKRDGSFARNDYTRKKAPANRGIAISSYPDTYIDTIFVKDGVLYLFGTVKDYEIGTLLMGLRLKELGNGMIDQKNGGGGNVSRCQKADGSFKEYSLWSLKLNTKDKLSNLTLVRPATGKSVLIPADAASKPRAPDPSVLMEYGDGTLLLTNGPWEITFPLNYQTVGRVINPKNETLTIRGYSYQIDEIRLSPFSAELDLIALKPRDPQFRRTRGWLDDEWDQLIATFTLRDGSILPLRTVFNSEENGSVHIAISHSVVQSGKAQQLVIDPQTVVSIQIGETTIPLSK